MSCPSLTVLLDRQIDLFQQDLSHRKEIKKQSLNYFETDRKEGDSRRGIFLEHVNQESAEIFDDHVEPEPRKFDVESEPGKFNVEPEPGKFDVEPEPGKFDVNQEYI